MARVYTYSFEDTTVTISHPNFGSYSAYGTGLGEIAVSYQENMTEHDVAADLAVVVSKIPKKNGTIQFTILQSSDLNDWLRRFTSYIENAPTNQWALGTITLTNKSTGDKYFATGVSHQKRPDNNFQSRAQNRTWTFMCANISNE